MKKLLIIPLLVLSFYSQANNQEVKNDNAKIIQAACSSLMREVLQQYGRSFFCKTTNDMATYMKEAFLTESLNDNAIGQTIKFFNVYYEQPNNPLSTLHYSYSIQDFNRAVAYINSGGGLTERQQHHMVCRKAIAVMRGLIEQTDIRYKNHEITNDEYYNLFQSQSDSISRMEKQCPNGIVLK